jgi:hypothetical protein
VVCVLGLDQQASAALPLTAWGNGQHSARAPACHTAATAAGQPEVNAVTNLQNVTTTVYATACSARHLSTTKRRIPQYQPSSPDCFPLPTSCICYGASSCQSHAPASFNVIKLTGLNLPNSLDARHPPNVCPMGVLTCMSLAAGVSRTLPSTTRSVGWRRYS